MHSSLLFTAGNHRVMIDCGKDWLLRVRKIDPEAILLTHAHADHAAGLRAGSPCPVIASAETWQVLRNYPLHDCRTIPAHTRLRIGGLQFQAFPVEHSLRAPAVGFRVSFDTHCVFYVPDVAAICCPSQALAGVDVYIGDGASIVRPLIRKRGGVRIGHASIAAQLRWCQEHGVRRAVFTPCGSQIVAGDERTASDRVRALGESLGVEAMLAHDGLRIVM
jgi:phosphoribosyl 1,2-cyclic phosphodiesterase